MTLDLGQRILEREIASTLSRRRTIRDLYGHRSLVRELDIVNELDGHTGCVNALSWSKSGRLLASGSDDQHLNIHIYQPEDSDKQFQLKTIVATGHTQNIFSVKFMPQSNDQTVVTCAGDGDVRVFDLEYSGSSVEASAAANRASTRRRAKRANSSSNVRLMTDGDTNARVYRSHADRVKRIVTESSPYLFLTCSEDGEVRQWDTRQPSSFYPRPRNNGHSTTDQDVPAPLISYSQYNLDLNTISCSASQPHYIALGGAHLHCFLHDRRMLGRDRRREAGRSGRAPRTRLDNDLMNEATRCVRKFAPKGQKQMGSDDRGHITACKISDARPNEMIVSWSGDHIYAFDLIRSPDADEDELKGDGNRALKRKRKTTKSSLTLGDIAAVRVRYGNGQEEDITIDDNDVDPASADRIRAQTLTRDIFKIRDMLTSNGENEDDQKAKYMTILEGCGSLIGPIDEVLREWSYPLMPSQHEVARQNRLREAREGSRRCIQAAGIIARLVLNGELPAPVDAGPFDVDPFVKIDNRMNELKLSARDKFIFDFMKAIFAWLDAGIGNLIESFTRPPSLPPTSKLATRLPIHSREDSDGALDTLVTYLREQLAIAPGGPILDPEANRFETDESREIFHSGLEAVQLFNTAVEQGFSDLSAGDEGSPGIARQDAIQFWAFRVARSLLLEALNRLNTVLETALGGDNNTNMPEDADSRNPLDEGLERAETMASDDLDLMDNGSAPSTRQVIEYATVEHNEDVDMIDDEFDDDDPGEEEEEEEDSSDPDEEDGVPNIGVPRYMRSMAERRRRTSAVGKGIPCNSAISTYKGHCNVRTVKDVNYFGLDDEYVVSGSDDGNLFIWEQKSGKLINVLEGDGEVVNVVQGHPYETMLAVSGIDDTIKIFSPDSHARENARLGQSVSAHDPRASSSPGFGRHSRGSRTLHIDDPRTEIAAEDDDYVADTGLRSRRRMNDAQELMQQNDMGRRRGDDDAVITRSMLQALAQRMRAQRVAMGGNSNMPLDGVEMTEDDDGRVRVVLSDDCVLM